VVVGVGASIGFSVRVFWGSVRALVQHTADDGAGKSAVPAYLLERDQVGVWDW
jgi:hypothetical protein